MRYSRTIINTRKEAPSDAETVSHKLLVRSGMIQKVAQGIYSFQPLGIRVIKKIEGIIREEMDTAGALEVLLPFVLPADLWIESGRWEQYGKELLRLQDRHGRWFCLGPTHEEAITDLVRREVRSYKQLPLNFYQIQVKFRDEIRPRFGLMRCREFIMKDGYSFHEDEASAEETYRSMHEAYTRIFERCGLKFRAVEADTGTIGGSFSHEFMVLADTGEEVILSCNSCGYAANLEKAETGISENPPSVDECSHSVEKIHTPGKKSVEEVSSFLKVKPSNLIKTIIFNSEGGPFAVLVRGDREVNTTKAARLSGLTNVELSDDATIEKVTGAHTGFAGPIGLKIKKFADNELKGLTGMVAGANEKDYHIVNIDVSRDISVDIFGDLRNAVEGDICHRCGSGRLRATKGIEVGHIFKLGAKYSSAMKAFFLDRAGREREFVMGCYGIGVGRTMAAAVEQRHDEKGIIWPVAIAPYTVVIIPVNWRDDAQRLMAEKLYVNVVQTGIDAILDDRDISPGVKFMDADLMGFPLRIVVGQKYIKENRIEIKRRDQKESELVEITEVIQKIKNTIKI
ncbi:MAG TPA: proline--tRNA ligase [bacterium]